MKTISGQCVSLKDVSLSKAAKILSKFVSADNGASQVINAYLHRASASFSELVQLHKELKSSHSHNKKHKRHSAETGGVDDSGRVVENSVPRIETNRKLSHGNMKFNDFIRQRKDSENADQGDEKSTPSVVKFNQELNGSVGHQMGNVDGSDKHKKNKKKAEVESRSNGDSIIGEKEDDGKLLTGAQNEIESGSNPGMEEEKKQKREKKKHKEGNRSFSSHKDEFENLDSKNEKVKEQKKSCGSVEGENGGLAGPQDSQIKKKKKYEAGSENKLYDEDAKMEQRKKRKSDDVGWKSGERSGDPTKKRMKRKHENDL